MLVRGIFTNISGSTGGVTASHNKGGQYLRARVTGVNPNSPAQQTARSRFTAANIAWSSLTPAERILWNQFAVLQTWTNRVGEPIQLSGQQAYVGAYSASESAGITPATVPPAPNTRPAALVIPAMIPNITATDVGTFTAGTQLVTDRYTIGASGPLPPGVTSYNGPYRIGATVPGNMVAAVFSGAIFVAIQTVGATPTPGQRFAIRIRTVCALGNYSTWAEAITGETVA